MKKLQFYKYTTWGLLAVNLLMLTFFFFRGAMHHADLRALDSLKLEEQQHEAFLTSAQRHEAKMLEIVGKQANLLSPYFNQLKAGVDTIDEHNLFAVYEQLETEKIKITYQHFEEIKYILKPNQQADFELFMDVILRKILPEPKKNKHPPKDF